MRDYAAQQFRKIAADIVFIEAQHVAGEMGDEEAQLNLEIPTNASPGQGQGAIGLA